MTTATITVTPEQRYIEAREAVNAAGTRIYGTQWPHVCYQVVWLFMGRRTSSMGGMTTAELESLLDTMNRPGFSLRSLVDPKINYGPIYDENGNIPFASFRI